MDANARTGRREKGQVGSKDSKILGAYGRDTLNDNGELLLSFVNNHDLALVSTFFSTPKGGVSHTFNGRGKKRIDYILTRQRDRKFVRNVTVHPQPSFLPISDHNIVSAPVKLLGHFARNRRLRASAKKPPVDCRRLVTDPQLRQEMASAVGRHLRANPPGDSSVDDVEAAFAAAIMRTAELVIPPQERRIPGRGWSGDARTEAELQAATDAMHTAWQRQRMDTRDAQLRRAVRKACNWLKRVRSAAVFRFFERHVVELEMQLRMGDQRGFFQNIKSVQLEETKKVESQCIRDEEGSLLRDKGRIRERWVRFFRSLLNSKSDMIDADIPKRLPQHPVASALGIEPTGGRDFHSDEDNGKRESGNTRWPSRRTTATRTSTRPDHPAGAPSAYHPHLAPGKSPTAVERRGHYSTPQEGRQDGVRKLPRHFARVTRG